jgi:hypothetical protein
VFTEALKSDPLLHQLLKLPNHHEGVMISLATTDCTSVGGIYRVQTASALGHDTLDPLLL